MNNVVIIVPCFNEENRLNYQKFIDFSNKEKIPFLFINDGSTDHTSKIIEKIILNTQNNKILNLKKNVGKAEAVRIGMLEALNKYESNLFGYWDADLATPLKEINLLIENFKLENNILVFGSRFKRLGNQISRSFLRHYLGRIFATITSIILEMGIYDTQCGAKIFHKDYVKHAFEKKFYTKWLFDIEIFFRLKKFNKKNQIIEIPLNSWEDIKESKLTFWDFIKTPYNFLIIIIKYKFTKN